MRIFVAAEGDAERGKWFDVGNEPGWCEAAFLEVSAEFGVDRFDVWAIDWEGLDRHFIDSIAWDVPSEVEDCFALLQIHGDLFLAACRVHKGWPQYFEERFVASAASEDLLADRVLASDMIVQFDHETYCRHPNVQSWWGEARADYEVVELNGHLYAFVKEAQSNELRNM